MTLFSCLCAVWICYLVYTQFGKAIEAGKHQGIIKTDGQK